MIKDFWSLHLARKTYAAGEEYYGTFPEGFEKKLMSLGIVSSPFVHLCSGTSELGDFRFDINPRARATHFQDARKTGLPDNFASFVLIDCYYTAEDYKKAGQTEDVSVYDFLKEAFRNCKTGGGNRCLAHVAAKKAKRNRINASDCDKHGTRQAVQMLSNI